MKKYSRISWVNLLLAIFIISPILVLIIWSFTARWPWPQLLPDQFSLRGFQHLWDNHDFLTLILSSVSLSLLVAFLTVIISLLSTRAYLLIKSKRLKNILYACISLPFLIPALVFAMGIHQAFIRLGLANSFLGVVLVHLVYSLPYANYLILDAYQTFGFKYEEQAYLLGAGRKEAFFQVGLPLLLPVMSSSFAMSYIVSFSQYFLTLLIGGGQVKTFSILIFPYLMNNDRTIASSYALVFLAINLTIFILFDYLAHFFQKKYQVSQYY